MSKQLETLDCPHCRKAYTALVTSSVENTHIGGGTFLTNTKVNIRGFATRAEAQKEMNR